MLGTWGMPAIGTVVDMNQVTPSGSPRRWLLIAACVVMGCSQRVPYADMGKWDSDVVALGPVQACQGGWCCHDGDCQWPLALSVPPPTETYHRALVDDAVKRYDVPADQVVLRQVVVTLHTEVVGTVRGWKAEAIAGRKPATAATTASEAKSGSIEERLRNLKALHDAGLISEDEFRLKRAAILEEL